jgi:hypothetical protein
MTGMHCRTHREIFMIVRSWILMLIAITSAHLGSANQAHDAD